jgi:hypothetical protein
MHEGRRRLNEAFESANGRIGGPVTVTELSKQSELLKASVTPDVWWVGTGTVAPFPLSMILIVRHTNAGDQRVGEWLRQRRNRIETHNILISLYAKYAFSCAERTCSGHGSAREGPHAVERLGQSLYDYAS